MDDILRLLEVITERLDAVDARLEVGGGPPSSERTVWASVGDGWRVVARFAAAVADPEAKRAQLEALLAAFEGVAARARGLAPTFAATPQADALAYALDVLRAMTGAAAAVVIDESSPVLWGASRPRPLFGDVPEALALAALADALRAARAPLVPTLAGDLPAPSHLRPEVAEALAAIRAVADPAARWTEDIAAARAIALVRRAGVPVDGHHHGADFGFAARPFGGAYALLLAFAGPFSEVAAEGALLRAVPAIDRLVEVLPAIDAPPRGPTPGGKAQAEVVRLAPPRRP